MNNTGIIAFGSLIDDPGKELEKFIVKKVPDIITPFKIEYGRKSSSRANAPTLIPIANGGEYVKATLLILSDELKLTEVKNMLYRRELHKVGSNNVYKDRVKPKNNHLVIKEHSGIQGVKIALSANFGQNLDSITPEILSDLAIKSFKSDNVEKGKDGISYLNNNIKNGIITPMTKDYKSMILKKMNATSLDEILKQDIKN